MSRNGTGGYNLPVNSWNPAVNGVAATATDWQSLINDVASAIQQSVSSDGQTAMTGPLNMGGNKLTSVANGSNSGDAVNYGQINASTGASLVGYLPAGVGAVATDTQTQFRTIGTVPVENYGAVGGGVTDDTTAIQLGIDTALSLGKRITGTGTYKITGKITFKGDADFSQATFLVYGTPAIAVEVSTGNASDPTTILYNSVVWLPKKIENMTKPGSGWAGQGIGVRTVNCYSCRVFFGNIINFAKNIQITSFGTGNSYNEYHLGHQENGQVNIDLSPGAGAWVNENNFYGGRFSHYSGEGTNVAGTRHIYVSNGLGNVPNSNIFYKPSIEGNVAEFHAEIGGSFITIVQARWEATTPKLQYFGTNANHGTRNVIRGGYGCQNIVLTTSGTIGLNNKIEIPGGGYESVSVAIGIQNQASSNNAIHKYYEAGTAPETAGASDWSYQASATYLSGKRKADTNERLKMDFVNGRLYFGTGAVAPASYIFGNASSVLVQATTSFYPNTDNTTTLGASGARWTTVFASTGTINTSDAREKQQVKTLSEKELAVAKKCKGLLRSFKFNDAVKEKGDKARIHFGVIAQELKAAFESEGLVAEDYAVLCYDEWPDELDADGNVIRPAGNLFGVRYEELMAFMIAAL